MLTFDSVRLRLDREQPLSFLEFNYMILQAYDFLELSRRVGCSLQMGGSDQWGNIVNGTDLIRRVDGRAAFGLTTPLITTADGAKMGKTAAGAVWLHEDMLPTYDYWQFWRNTHDADVGRFLRLFTDLPLDEIARLEALEGAEINAAKKILATEATGALPRFDGSRCSSGDGRETFAVHLSAHLSVTSSLTATVSADSPRYVQPSLSRLSTPSSGSASRRRRARRGGWSAAAGRGSTASRSATKQ